METQVSQKNDSQTVESKKSSIFDGLGAPAIAILFILKLIFSSGDGGRQDLLDKMSAHQILTQEDKTLLSSLLASGDQMVKTAVSHLQLTEMQDLVEKVMKPLIIFIIDDDGTKIKRLESFLEYRFKDAKIYPINFAHLENEDEIFFIIKQLQVKYQEQGYENFFLFLDQNLGGQTFGTNLIPELLKFFPRHRIIPNSGWDNKALKEAGAEGETFW